MANAMRFQPNAEIAKIPAFLYIWDNFILKVTICKGM
jgi:hypothetical protein